MAEHHNLYQRAVYYDIALERNVSREVEFIQQAYQYYAGKRLRSALDLACGPGYHARALASRGVRAVGLDLRPEMLDLAREKANDQGVDVTWLRGDMREFWLDQPVDMVLCMFDSLDALLSNAELVRNFRAVADNLTSSGLFLIDITHPRDCNYQDYGDYRYAGERDGVQVEIMWAVEPPEFDLVAGTVRVAVEMHVDDHSEKHVIPDSAVERLLDPQELILLAQLSGRLEAVGWHGDYDLDQPLDNSPNSARMIGILKKKGST